jgi:PAS domain S-box-containing protein
MPGSSAENLPAELAKDVLAAIFETSDLGSLGLVVTISSDPPTVLFVNSVAARMLGYEHGEELRAVPIWNHFEPATLARVKDMAHRKAAGAPIENRFELWVKRKDGSRIPVEVVTSRVVIGGKSGNVTLLHDLSSHHQAADALRASESRFRSVVETAPDGVAILRGPRILYLNPRAAHMLGIESPEKAVGRVISDLLHPDDAPVARDRIQTLLRTQSRLAEPAQYRSRSVDGREITVEISSIPIEYEGGPAVLAFARDITERISIQEKLVQADRLAAVGTLAAGIAHEINNPLAYVLLGLQYLERELPKILAEPGRLEDTLGRIRDVRNGAERVGTIVRDLKMFARADEVQRGPVDPKQIVEAAIKIADNEIRHRATLVRDYAEVPAIDGNAARLEQVFLNLLVNAAHAVSEVDAARSEVRVRLRRGHGGTVVAEVTDNGCGMSEDVLLRVFDPFFTTKPIGVGTGLGLPICRSIVQGFGGQIEVESAEGMGTTVRVILPAYVSSRTSEIPEEPVRPPSAPPGARTRVLVVDDEPLVASLLQRMLQPLHDVAIATSGPEALRAIEEVPFDAIVCDVMMPGMTGMELYATLRQRDEALASRMVFMTGGAFVPRVAEFLSGVPNPKLEKPFPLSALQIALRDLAGGRGDV